MNVNNNLMAYTPFRDSPSWEETLGTHLPQEPCEFTEFIEPNENPKHLADHLAQMKPGWILSTGTERSLFDLLLAPKGCEGVFIRDVNWKVKAYLDCIVLLLRICKTPEELTQLAEPVYSQLRYEERSENIRLLLINAEIPSAMKEYYLDNLFTLTWVYLNRSGSWTEKEEYQIVNYFKNREQFEKLQNFAKSGKIIATVGSIVDLTWPIKPTLIDTSNISDYEPLDIDVADARVISTKIGGNECDYFSHTCKPASDEEKVKFRELFERQKKAYYNNVKNDSLARKLFALHLYDLNPVVNRFDYTPIPFCAQKSLALLARSLY